MSLDSKREARVVWRVWGRAPEGSWAVHRVGGEVGEKTRIGHAKAVCGVSSPEYALEYF